MNEFEDLVNEDERVREIKEGEYQIESVTGCSIGSYTPGLRLIDFYRTSDVLVKDVKPVDKP